MAFRPIRPIRERETVSDSLWQHLKNETSVVGQTLVDAPGAIWDEVANDWNNDRRNLLTRAGVSVGMGAGFGVLLSRSPLLGGTVVAAGTAYFGLKLASGVTPVMGRAWDADTDSERQALVAEASSKIGREGATLLETAPGLAVGGGAGIWASRRVAALDRMAFKVTEVAEFPARQMIPEKLHWVGPGTERLPKTLLKPDGRVDMFQLSELLAKRHPWQSVEVIRSVRLSDMKASRPAPGTPIETELGFADKPGHILFHSHPPALRNGGSIVSGARPSVEDLAGTMDAGIIQSGDLTTIYEGAARHVGVSAKGFSPTLRSVIIDRKNQLAVELETRWSPDLRAYHPAVPRPLNYDQTVKVLSNWDRWWKSIEEIQTDFGALASPASTRLLKIGAH